MVFKNLLYILHGENLDLFELYSNKLLHKSTGVEIRFPDIYDLSKLDYVGVDDIDHNRDNNVCNYIRKIYAKALINEEIIIPQCSKCSALKQELIDFKKRTKAVLTKLRK